MKDMDYGVFMPVCSTGWIASVNAPHLPGTYAYNKQVIRLAEELGFDHTLSQSGWRGDGGVTRHQEINLESLTTSTGLASVTDRISVWSTANVGTYAPAVLAKIVATQQQISGGRSGLNVVAGGNPKSEGSLGLWHGLDHAGRYRKAREWVSVMKGLWTEDRFDFDGEFYKLTDAESYPKPSTFPTLLSAATSEDGVRFSASMLDAQLFEGMSKDAVVKISQRIQRICGDVGRPLKKYCIWMIIPGETDRDAQRRIEFYDEGRDVEALANHIRDWKTDVPGNEYAQRVQEAAMTSPSISTGTIAGSVETITEKLSEVIDEADLDGVFFIMPDFIGDLTVIGKEIMPRLARNGFPGRTQVNLGLAAAR